MQEPESTPKDFSHSSQKGLFSLIRNFFPFLRIENKEQRSLVGRIHAQLQRDAHAMLLELQTLKRTMRKELNNQTDCTLWNSFEALINPLLREYSLIEKQLLTPPENSKESKIRNVHHWIDRAKIWVSLCAQPANREGIVKAVIEQTYSLLDQMIDRDLKTIADYKEHELNLLGLGEEAQAVVMGRLNQDLTFLIEGLLKLKREKPKKIKLDVLINWKTHVDEERTHLFNSALQMIDNIVNSAIPAVSYEEEQEHLRDLIAQVIHLENEMQMLALKCHDEGPLDREMIVMTMAHYEEQLDRVHHDLRLTPKLLERVQTLIQQMDTLRARF